MREQIEIKETNVKEFPLQLKVKELEHMKQLLIFSVILNEAILFNKQIDQRTTDTLVCQ